MTDLDLAGEPSTPRDGGVIEAEPFVPREKRHVTILLVARLVLHDGEDQLCRIRNISSGGLMLDTSAALQPGQRIDVELRGLCRLRGAVVWTRTGRAGVQLDSAADVPELLRSISGKPAEAGAAAYVPRPPRLTTDCPVRILSGGRTFRGRMLDLSQRGARLRSSRWDPEDQITLHVPGLEPQKAAVRWTNDEEAGVVFFETLAYQQLDAWLQVRGVRHALREGGS